MIAYAENYISQGFFIFPCNLDKTPQTPHGFYDATNDLNKFKSFLNGKKWQIAIRTGDIIQDKKFFVLDIDVKNGITAETKLEALTQSFGEIPETIKISTPSGGIHLYFFCHKDLEIKNKINCFKEYNNEALQGIDIKGDNGYVIAPCNNNYIITDSEDDFLDIEKIAEAPLWLLESISISKIKTITPNVLEKTLTPTMSEEIKSALQYFDVDDRQDWLEVGLMFYNEKIEDGFDLWTEWSKQSHKYDEKDQVRVWRSFGKTIKGNPITLSSLFYKAYQKGWAGYSPAPVKLAFNETKPQRGKELPKFPAHLFNTGVLLQEIYEYIESQAIKSQPIFSLSAAIVTVATAFARKVQTPTGLRTNFYVMNVGRSGCGKDNARQMIKKIFDKAGQFRRVAVESLASGSAINTALTVEPASLFLIDEIGRLLKTIKNSNKTAPHIADIIDTLLKIYSSAGTRYQPKTYADKTKNISINQPCLLILGTTTEQVLFDSLTSENAEDGFLSRFVLFFSENPNPRPRFPFVKEPPEHITEFLKEIMEMTVDEAIDNPKVKTLEFTEGAFKILENFADKIYNLQNDLINKGKEHQANLYNRTIQIAQQYALVKACSDRKEYIDEDCIIWGTELAQFNAEQMAYIFEHYVADNQTQANLNKVYNTIQKFNGISQSELTRKLQNMTARERNEAIATLVEAGRIIIYAEESGKKGRISKRFYLAEDEDS